MALTRSDRTRLPLRPGSGIGRGSDKPAGFRRDALFICLSLRGGPIRLLFNRGVVAGGRVVGPGAGGQIRGKAGPGWSLHFSTRTGSPLSTLAYPQFCSDNTFPFYLVQAEKEMCVITREWSQRLHLGFSYAWSGRYPLLPLRKEPRELGDQELVGK